jgi:hypothetical protein
MDQISPEGDFGDEVEKLSVHEEKCHVFDFKQRGQDCKVHPKDEKDLAC